MVSMSIHVRYSAWGFTYIVKDGSGAVFVNGVMRHSQPPEGGSKRAIYRACAESAFTKTLFLTDDHGRIIK